MKLEVQLRTVSRNGQIAIPKRFLEALGLGPLTKVQVIQKEESIVIRKGPMTRMSDEAFLELLNRIRKRNSRLSRRQVAEAIRQVRRQD